MTTLPFVKVEGLGNDFLLVDALDADRDAVEAELATWRERAPMLCDRRRGVGADGILLVAPAATASHHATMWVVNHDGSRPEMCGNGLRCVAHFVAHRRGLRAPVVETDDGPKPCTVEGDAVAAQVEVEVDMGPGRDLGHQAPAAGGGRDFHDVSMGNPHAIHFVKAGEDPEGLARTLGPRLEVDAAYPARTNVEFARRTEGGIVLWVWERGCGITDACGTGACATACAAVWQGLAPAGEPIAVDLPGGRLSITVPTDPAAGVRMRGPARRVFHGSVEL